MRRDLSAPFAEPRWPGGVVSKTLGPTPDRKVAKAAHGVLEAGFWEGGGGAPIFRQWWNGLRRDREFDPSLVFLAVRGDEIVGIAQCWTSGFIKDLAVHPAARGLGIGRALLLTVFHEFARRGAASVDLKVREENAPAQRLYRDLGMQVVERIAD